MCGVLGVISDQPVELDLRQLQAVLGHRGPDGAGVKTCRVCDQHLTLGHVRLAILDRSDAGNQPMTSRDGRWCVSYNGEIYNHQQLRTELGGSFQGGCDTETLVAALATWGLRRTLDKINGIFAFAAFDLDNSKLYLVRDRFGTKPLYCRQHDKGFDFASEMRGLSLLNPVDRSVDQTGLGMFMLYRYTPSPHTLWSGVSRVPPGHYVSYDVATRRQETVRYLTPTRAAFQGDEAAASMAYKDVLSEAIQRQLLSDVPIGVLLSGGIDSAIVAALAVNSGASPTAFTVGFGEEHPECEIGDAGATAAFLGVKHETVTMDAESAWAALTPALDQTEEPLGTTSLIPMWHLSALAAKSVPVVLTGQGTDELFGGYRRYQGELLGQYVPRGKLWSKAAILASHCGQNGQIAERALRSLGARDEAHHHGNVHALFTDAECQTLGVDVDEVTRLTPLRDWLGYADACGVTDAVARMMSVDTRMNLADDLLLYGDRVSMAHSVEARVPMLDHEVVAFVESLPRKLRVRLRHPKYLHRMVAAELLPPAILNRPKLGFQVPFGTWARGIWRDRLAAEFFDSNSLGNVVDLAGVRMIWNQHQSGRRDRTRQIFALLALARWSTTWGKAA